MIINNFAKKAYKAYVSFGLTPEGACSLMGNQHKESQGFTANKMDQIPGERYYLYG